MKEVVRGGGLEPPSPEAGHFECPADTNFAIPALGPCELSPYKLGRNRYPTKRFRGKRINHSRAVWEENIGAIPEGMFVLHRCDNPLCIRLDHLFLGTHEDNMKDMVSKGRSNRERIADFYGKLTRKEVESIRQDRRKLKEIAAEYKVSISTISLARRGKTWRTDDE